jgi:hypothetical protein
MENTFWTALGTSLLAAFVTSLGIYTIRRFAGWGLDHNSAHPRQAASANGVR